MDYRYGPLRPGQIATEASVYCHICTKPYSSVHVLNRHINTVHLKIKGIKCKFCDNKFAQSGSMYTHMKKTHPEEYTRYKRERTRERYRMGPCFTDLAGD